MKNRSFSFSLHPTGWPFVTLFAGTTFLLFFLGKILFFIGLVLTLWCVYFFRDPLRVTPARASLIVSPADGKIVAIQEIVPEAEFLLGDAPRTRISIFLNVFDVHVNRIPAAGTVISRRYRAGKFFNAALDKASIDNERMALTIRLEGDHPLAGVKICVVQIAGLIARRIVCYAQEQQLVQTGERYGIIRFGSRADLYLPPGVRVMVTEGQYMIGGETVIADMAAAGLT